MLFFTFLSRHELAAWPILSSRSFPRLWWWSLSVAHKRQRLKQWPIRPRSESPLRISIYFASFRCKLHCPCKITRTTTFLSSPLDVLPKGGFVELPKFQACVRTSFRAKSRRQRSPKGVRGRGQAFNPMEQPPHWFNGILRLRLALPGITRDEAHASITTGVPSSTNSNSSITSALRIRTQPWLAAVPILFSCFVP
jgi:hypothetical protein